MNKSAVYHKTTDNYCYCLDSDNLNITIQTGHDIKQITLCYDDPFAGGLMGSKHSKRIFNEKIMHYHVELDDVILWSVTVKPEFKRCSYFFKITDGNETLYYMEDGFHTSPEPKPSERIQYFIFPWMNPSDINIVPEWVNKTIWYQIFPERFCNGDSSLNPMLTKPWKNANQPVKMIDFYGGDLPGIISKLEYLHDLGITGIYLTPVCKSRSNHKYDIIDYMHIDPHFGTDEQMRELVDKAHSLGIRVMMDGVFNHSSTLFFPWRDVVKKGPESKYYDWFMVNKWPFEKVGFHNARKGNYYSFAFVDAMPKLNTNNPEVIRYFVKVCMSWIKKYDIDGIRLDVLDETSHTFCRALRKNLKKIKPDIFLLGESWHESMPWLRGTELDSVMNYPLKDSINAFWLDSTSDKSVFEHAVNRCYNLYMQQTNSVLFNLLDSHDTTRLITSLNDINLFYQQLAVLFTMPGSVCIYYGTEIALEGQHDPDCRRCMPWKDIEAGTYDNKIAQIKQLISLRKDYASVRSNSYHFNNNYDNPRIISYNRYDVTPDKIYEKGCVNSAPCISVVLNCSDEKITVNTDNQKILFSNLFNNNILSPNGTLIYVLREKQ